MVKRSAILFVSALLMFTLVGAAHAADFKAVPFEFDPDRTNLVAAKWKSGLGCPSNGGVVPAAATSAPPPFSDPGCPTTDARDTRDDGLLLSKAGPTAINASAGATILGVNGITLTEIGYDLRKPDAFTDIKGSHCGAGSPRFNIVTKDGVTHFIGCQSPAPIQTTVGSWIRLRWAPSKAFPPIGPTARVKRIEILLDEGPDTGPDNFGLAVLDNIDINGTLIGRGPTTAEEADQDQGSGGDGDHHFAFSNSASRPETSNVSYQDIPQSVKVQTISDARSITYNGACVSFVADALLNYEPGYVLTFAACDLSALSTPLVPQIGNYSVAVTGAPGVVYQKSGALTSGVVQIHPH